MRYYEKYIIQWKHVCVKSETTLAIFLKVNQNL